MGLMVVMMMMVIIVVTVYNRILIYCLRLGKYSQLVE